MNGLKSLGLAWRERLWLWLPAVLFAALMLVLFMYYQASGMGAEVDLLEQRINSAAQREQQLNQQRQQLERLLADVELNRQRVVELYSDRLATQEERLTAVLAEVRRLATQAGMAPTSVSYPQESLEDFGLVQTAFVFSVEGSYADLRRFINSLELTPTFLTLESISLSGEAGSSRNLSISLRISTLFAADDAEYLETEYYDVGYLGAPGVPIETGDFQEGGT